MLFTPSIAIILGLLIAATITDLRWREVPDWLSFAGIGAGIGIGAIKSLSLGDPSPFLHGMIGLGVGFALALLMFYSGQWGGGDSKMIMAIGALLGINFTLTDTFLAFVSNLILVGGAYGLIWTLGVGIQHRTKVIRRVRKQFSSRGILLPQAGLIGIGLLGLASAVFMTQDPAIRFAGIGLSLLFPTMFFATILLKTIEHCCFIRSCPVDDLTEGDWIVKEIHVKGKRICGPKDLGITREQIQHLRKLGVRSVQIKEGMPFLPAFLLAFLLTIAIGNVFMVVAQVA